MRLATPFASLFRRSPPSDPRDSNSSDSFVALALLLSWLDLRFVWVARKIFFKHCQAASCTLLGCLLPG